MNGLVIDIVLVYAFKSIRHIVRFFESIRWHRRSAAVLQVDVEDPFWGCPSVNVSYQFVSNDMKQNAYAEIPFLFRWSAKRYARRIKKATGVIVRVNPGSPRKTMLFDFDQRQP